MLGCLHMASAGLCHAGFVKCSLQLLTAQVDRLQTRDNPDGDIAIPSWVDALLLALHSMLQSTAKPTEPAAPSGAAPAAGSSPHEQQGREPNAGSAGPAPVPSAAGPSAAPAAGSAPQPSAAASADQGAAAPAGQQGSLLEGMRESLVKTLEEQHRPGGLLSPEQQDLAAMVSPGNACQWHGCGFARCRRRSRCCRAQLTVRLRVS